MKKHAIVVLQTVTLLDQTTPHHYTFWTKASGERTRPRVVLKHVGVDLLRILSEAKLRGQSSCEVRPSVLSMNGGITLNLDYEIQQSTTFKVIDLGLCQDYTCVAIVMTQNRLNRTPNATQLNNNIGIVEILGHVRDGTPQPVEVARQSLRHFLGLDVSAPGSPEAVAELQLFDYISKWFEEWKRNEQKKDA